METIKLILMGVAAAARFGVMTMCRGALALASGVVGYIMANRGAVTLDGWLAARIPPARHALFLADLFAHTASYGGGLVLCVGGGSEVSAD